MIVADSPGLKPTFNFLFFYVESLVPATRPECVGVQDPVDELGGGVGSLGYEANDNDANDSDAVWEVRE